jgi:hypothetical protein
MPPKKKRAKPSKARKTADLTLKLSVEVVPARRKSIKPRKRPNLRTMRNGMGGLTPANLRLPSFYGNTALLTNSAMAAMNNKAYSIERQLLDYTAEARAQLDVGRDVSQRTQAQIDDLQRDLEMTRAMAQRPFGESTFRPTPYPETSRGASRRSEGRAAGQGTPQQSYESYGGVSMVPVREAERDAERVLRDISEYRERQRQRQSQGGELQPEPEFASESDGEGTMTQGWRAQRSSDLQSSVDARDQAASQGLHAQAEGYQGVRDSLSQIVSTVREGLRLPASQGHSVHANARPRP